MRKVRSSTFAIALVLSLLVLCVLGVAIFLSAFAGSNFSAITKEFNQITTEDNVSQSLADANIRVGPNMHIRETIADVVQDDACLVPLGEIATLENVNFLVQPSRAVVRAEDAAASVDVAIQNNSSQTLIVPIDSAWTALCHKGNKLAYSWDCCNDSTPNCPKKMRGEIDPGQTYQVTLVFSDCDGQVADAVVVSAELNRPLDGVNQIYWLAE